MYANSDTIAAIATPPGLGGIAVLRISGPAALTVLYGIFRSHTKVHSARTTSPTGVASPAAQLSSVAFSFKPRLMHFGHAVDKEGERVDDVLAVYMPGPHSATGEDVGEIHCHGGSGVTTAVLEAAFSTGARLAEPGEFTRRAFLNGRMDLTQAEAVAEIIAATTTQGARLAQAKLDGALGETVRRIDTLLESCRVQVTLAVDFPDEDAELLHSNAFTAAIADARREIEMLLAGFQRARLWREGATAVLAGQVNVGKSSLLNALVGRQRAIVSPVAGTTRDYIEESINIHGLPVRIIDTAGLRSTGDVVEEEGMRLSHELAEQADVLVLVMDAQRGPQPDDEKFLERHQNRVEQGKVVLVFNKADILARNTSLEPPLASSAQLTALAEDCAAQKSLPPAFHGCPLFWVSAKMGTGLEPLAAAIYNAIVTDSTINQATAGHSSDGSAPPFGYSNSTGDIAPNLRQSQLLQQAAEELAALGSDVSAGMPTDILGVRLETAAALLGEVTGVVDNEAILNKIFSSFCIGK